MRIHWGKVLLAAVLCIGVTTSCEWDYDIWIPRSADADPLYRFVEHRKAGYIDQNGAVVIPPTYRSYGNSGGEFHSGLLNLDSGEYVDQSGNKLKVDVKSSWDFSEGLAAALAPNGLWGYIDSTGKFAIPPQFQNYPNGYVNSFSDGLAKIEINGLNGYINHSGTFVIPPTLLGAADFHDGFARVVVKGPCAYFEMDQPCGGPVAVGAAAEVRNIKTKLLRCKFTFIDKSGRMISLKGYDYALEFSEGLAPVLVGKKWGYIDDTGELAIAPQFERAQPFEDGLVVVMFKDKYGFIDHSGKYVIPAQFEQAQSFAEGFAVVGTSNRAVAWYINHNGRQAFGRKFTTASSFFKGLAQVELLPDKDAKRGKFEYIDHEGKTVFAYSTM